MDLSEPRTLMLIGALSIGGVFGVTARLSGFCLRSAIIEVIERRSGNQFVAWLTALAVAVVTTQALVFSGVVDLGESIYLTSDITWLATIPGGLLFGLGMVLTRGCGGRHLVLAAGGNLRSWIVLTFLGLTAYMTLRGILSLPRTWLESVASVPADVATTSLGTAAASAFNTPAAPASFAVALVIGASCLVAVIRARPENGHGTPIIAGAIIGLTIAAGWYVTNVVGLDEFEPIRTESISFTSPLGNAIQYLLTYTGNQANFGIAVIGGTLVSAFLTAAATRGLNLQGFDTPRHLLLYIGGAAMMGFGGVLALGCTVGAGLTGVSTLSVVSVIALISIVAGATIGHCVKVGSFGARATEVVPAE